MMEGRGAGIEVCARSGVLVGCPNLHSDVEKVSNWPSCGRLGRGAGEKVDFPLKGAPGGCPARRGGVLG